MASSEKTPLLAPSTSSTHESESLASEEARIAQDTAAYEHYNHTYQLPQDQQQQRPSRTLRSIVCINRTMRTVLTIAILGAVWLSLVRYVHSMSGSGDSSINLGVVEEPIDSAPYSTAQAIRKVPLEAHIMSKCPDAKDCLRDLVVPTMMEVSDMVDFKLSYIGKPTEHDDGVECKHGPGECLGNILELCAAKIYPDPKLHLGFTMCMTNRYKDIPERDLVEECALEHGISFDKLNDCASDEHLGKGMDLLKESVERSSELNVTLSCTVRVDEKIWCVRDGGEWKSCPGGSSVRDLVSEIRKLGQS